MITSNRYFINNIQDSRIWQSNATATQLQILNKGCDYKVRHRQNVVLSDCFTNTLDVNVHVFTDKTRVQYFRKGI